MKYQEGGSVSETSKPAEPKKTPVPNVRKPRLRDLIPENERRELDAPLTPEDFQRPATPRMKKGGMVKMAGGGCTRGDGIASRGKTKGRMI